MQHIAMDKHSCLLAPHVLKHWKAASEVKVDSSDVQWPIPTLKEIGNNEKFREDWLALFEEDLELIAGMLKQLGNATEPKPEPKEAEVEEQTVTAVSEEEKEEKEEKDSNSVSSSSLSIAVPESSTTSPTPAPVAGSADQVDESLSKPAADTPMEANMGESADVNMNPQAGAATEKEPETKDVAVDQEPEEVDTEVKKKDENEDEDEEDDEEDEQEKEDALVLKKEVVETRVKELEESKRQILARKQEITPPEEESEPEEEAGEEASDKKTTQKAAAEGSEGSEKKEKAGEGSENEDEDEDMDEGQTDREDNENLDQDKQESKSSVDNDEKEPGQLESTEATMAEKQGEGEASHNEAPSLDKQEEAEEDVAMESAQPEAVKAGESSTTGEAATEASAAVTVAVVESGNDNDASSVLAESPSAPGPEVALAPAKVVTEVPVVEEAPQSTQSPLVVDPNQGQGQNVLGLGQYQDEAHKDEDVVMETAGSGPVDTTASDLLAAPVVNAVPSTPIDSGTGGFGLASTLPTSSEAFNGLVNNPNPLGEPSYVYGAQPVVPVVGNPAQGLNQFSQNQFLGSGMPPMAPIPVQVAPIAPVVPVGLGATPLTQGLGLTQTNFVNVPTPAQSMPFLPPSVTPQAAFTVPIEQQHQQQQAVFTPVLAQQPGFGVQPLPVTSPPIDLGLQQHPQQPPQQPPSQGQGGFGSQAQGFGNLGL